MFNCDNNDELIQLIKKNGFNPVLTPRDNIEPLDLLIRNDKGVLAWIKDLFQDETLKHIDSGLMDLFEGDSTLEIEESKLATEISGSKSSKVDLEASVELAMYFLKAKDNTASDDDRKAALKAAFQTMNKVSFSIDGNTLKRGVSWSQLDSYLSNAEIRKDLETLKEMVVNNQVYIITHVLSSDSFTFNGENTATGSIEAKMPEIAAMLEGNFKGAVNLTESSGVKYKGETQMVFGVEAVLLSADVPEIGKTSYRIRSIDGLKVRGDGKFAVEEQLELDTNDNFLVFE